MSHPEYQWRQLTPEERKRLLAWRKQQGNPWHSPPHPPNFGQDRFLITAACYEHRPYIGTCPSRMDDFAGKLLSTLASHCNRTFAWCVLPNHYHVLVGAHGVRALMRELGKMHGRTSYAWNGEENARGRKVFFRAVDRAMRSEGHFFATLNYVHNNPVHHEYVHHWTDWPWSSAADYLAQTTPEEAKRVWLEYPLNDYGRGWDDSEL